jgi:hypothetical protein
MRPLRWIVLMCMVVTAQAAWAAPADVVLFPAAPLAADGERTHELRLYVVAGDALAAGLPVVRAARGAIVGAPAASADGGIVVRYRPPKVTAPARDTLTVVRDGRETRLPVALEPAGRLQLTLEVPEGPIVLARGAKTTLRLHVRDAAGRPAAAPLRVSASVGTASAAREVATGEYAIDYSPPDVRYPEVAIVAAFSVSDGAYAAAPLKLAAHVTVDGEGEPGASMKISVDGQPPAATIIGADGRFSLPLLVPPGGHAVGVSVDTLGNQQKRDIDLALPPFPRLLMAAVPALLPADGRSHAEVIAYAVDERGVPEKSAPPDLTADAGTLSPAELRGDGSTAWIYTAPSTMATMGPGAPEVRLHAPGGETRIALRAGPPRRLVVTPPSEPLQAGFDSPATLEARLTDAAGAPVAGAELHATLAGGRVLRVRDRGAGRYAIDLVPPRDSGRGTAQLHVEVANVPPGPPRRVTLHLLPAADGTWGAEAWLDDDVGLPVANAAVTLEVAEAHVKSTLTTDRFGTARLRFPAPTTRTARVTAEPAALPGVGAALDLLVVGGVVHAVASAAAGGVVDAEAVAAPSFPSVDVAVPLRPAAFADVRLQCEPARPHVGQPVRVHVDLRAGDPSQLLYQSSAGSLEVVRPPGAGPGELRFIPPDDTRPGARYIISVTDAKTHVTAFTEIQVQ